MAAPIPPVLDRKLWLEARDQTADGAGGYTEGWTALGAHWARVKARSGRERGQGDVPLSRVTYRILVRASPTGAPSRPVAGQRFRDGAQVFAIEAVAETEGLRGYLTCFASQEEVSA